MKMFLDANFLIYLNTGEQRAWSFFESLVPDNILYTDALVLDETLYISKKKYGVRYTDTADFIKGVILASTKILRIGEEELAYAMRLLHTLDPSDAIHIAVMIRNKEKAIVSENKRLDAIKTIKRIWLQ